MSFLDLEKAFVDIHVPWHLIWHSLHSHGTPKEYIQWIQLLYTNTTSIVLVGLSELCPITLGVHQGSVLSPLLLILCMDRPTVDIQVLQPWSLLFLKIIFGVLCLLWYDSGEQTGSEVGEREEGRIGKGPRAGIRTRDACNAMTLYVNALPIWLSAPTALVTSIRYLPSWQNPL